MVAVLQGKSLGSARKEDKSAYRCLVLCRLSSLTRTCHLRARAERHPKTRHRTYLFTAAISPRECSSVRQSFLRTAAAPVGLTKRRPVSPTHFACRRGSAFSPAKSL